MIQSLSLPWYLSTVFTSTLFPAVGLLEAVPEKYVANDPKHQAEALTSFYGSVQKLHFTGKIQRKISVLQKA